MDPIAHTLVGATLAESGLAKRAGPLATATLLLGANAPDIDIVSAWAGRDASLGFRRGHTHGIVAMFVLPLVLTGLVLAWDRLVRRRRRPDAPPARAGPIFALALLSVLTHPALDWLNTYGVRLLMPFDGTWFYGDALFIVDPWLWLLMAAAAVLARSRGKLSAAAWMVLGLATTALVVATDMPPLGAKIAWALGLGAIVALRLSHAADRRVPAVAIGCIAALAVYIVVMVLGSRMAQADARRWLIERGIVPQELAAAPEPANPFVREVIARTGDRYYFVERAFWGDPPMRFSHPPIPMGERDAVVRAALEAEGVQGLRRWLRFPSFETVATADGYTVTVRDVRYSRRASGGLGTAVVRLDRDLRPLGVEPGR